MRTNNFLTVTSKVGGAAALIIIQLIINIYLTYNKDNLIHILFTEIHSLL